MHAPKMQSLLYSNCKFVSEQSFFIKYIYMYLHGFIEEQFFVQAVEIAWRPSGVEGILPVDGLG